MTVQVAPTVVVAPLVSRNVALVPGILRTTAEIRSGGRKVNPVDSASATTASGARTETLRYR